MENVMIESPYAGDVEINEDYARRCLLDSLRRGEAPMAGHLLYTQVLNDGNESERALGIAAHIAWLRHSNRIAVYEDLGVTSGMWKGIDVANAINIPIERRRLPGYVKPKLIAAKVVERRGL